MEPRHLALDPVHGELRQGQAVPAPHGAELRGLDHQPVRASALFDLLQDLYREGLGDALRRDERRLGRPADQGPVAVGRRRRRAQAQPRAQQAAQRRAGGQDPARDLPLSPPRPRHDVGRRARPDRRTWRHDPDGPRAEATFRRRPGRLADDRDRPGRRPRDRGASRHQFGADARAGRAAPPASRDDRPGQRAQVPRLPDRRAQDQVGRPLSRQLDLHPRQQGEGRPHPELPLLVARDGAGRGRRLRRPRIFLLRGRRPVVDGRRRARRPRHAGDGPARPRHPGQGDRRRGGAPGEGLSGL